MIPVRATGQLRTSLARSNTLLPVRGRDRVRAAAAFWKRYAKWENWEDVDPQVQRPTDA